MTMPAHDMPWSGEQREWLQALGHELMTLAPAGSEGQAEPEPPHREAIREPRAANAGAAARPAASASPLLRALARAAACNEGDAEFLAVVSDPAALRGNPAARRALWPRLRALRKRSAQ